MRFVDPKNDVAFKKIFGDENKKEILISFLNNILDYAGTNREIVEISIANPYQTPKLEGLKHSILDINALDKRGIHFIIEMQVIHTEAFEKRVLYYASKAYTQQLKRAEEYPNLNPVIFLGILDFKLFKKSSDYTSRHLILELKTNEHTFTDFEFNFVELPKFEKTLDQLENVKDKWIYFIKHAGDMTMIPEEMTQPKEIREAFETANEFGWTQEEMDAYDAKGIIITDERQALIYARKEGKEIGEKIGIEKGEKIGIEKTAIKMLNEGMSPDLVSKCTGLSLDEIEILGSRTVS